MKFFRKVGAVFIIVVVCFILSCAISIPVLAKGGFNYGKPEDFGEYLRWIIFWFIVFILIANITISHRIAQGKAQEFVFFISSALIISMVGAYIIFTLTECKFEMVVIDWRGTLEKIIHGNWIYNGIVFIFFVAFSLLYGTLIDKRMFNFFGTGGIRGNGKLRQVEDSNLENSRWMSNEEKSKNFKTYKYSKLDSVKKDGIPVAAKLTYKDRDLDVSFNSPCHTLVIGSTGSGKTTTFVSPMIQLLGATKAGSSMIITDPKGELFSLHSKYLKSRGYDVKVIDLRDTYSSYRWNPLDAIWDSYEKYVNAHKLAFKRIDNVDKSGLKKVDSEEEFKKADCWYEFEGKAYAKYDNLISAVIVFKKRIFDEVYEDLNDLVSVLIPIENEKDPMWEKGARSIALATLLAMLEDYQNPALNMSKEKFNFFNLAKILQNSSNDYADLRNYFKGRSPLSKALSLSKQVCDAATQTRASYMSIVYEKLTLFNDAGICALTSASDFSSEQLAYKPTALFLKIPDEKDTRHNLAAIFILNIYKTLIKVASSKEDLTLDRNVYFIMDEFGNMPKIEKFDKFITVGRSRKIWFTMIVQSYAQLNNVYGETVADIVKGNCGIKMFIGSNDMGTCKEYSELCGNITVVTTSTSSNMSSQDTNYSMQTQVRPLIYPSELQRLNHPGDIGHSIIVTFGNYPLMTYFSPSFKVPFYKTGKMDLENIQERVFNEKSLFYDVRKRNELVLKKAEPSKEVGFNGIVANNQEQPKQADNQVESKKQTEKENTDNESNSGKLLEEEKLLKEFRAWKIQNPDGSFIQFCKQIISEEK